MAQQINLCLPILRKQKESFTAQRLVLALLILLLGGAAIVAAWVVNLNRASAGLHERVTAQDKEMRDLQNALEQVKANAGPVQAALMQELAQQRALLQERQSVDSALKQGLTVPGRGHAARLQLVAQTIPAVAWVTQLKADTQMLQLSGFTREPAALNTWVARLAQSDLLQGQSLNTIQVEKVVTREGKPGADAGGPAASVWSFSLMNRLAPSAPTGGKP